MPEQWRASPHSISNNSTAKCTLNYRHYKWFAQPHGNNSCARYHVYTDIRVLTERCGRVCKRFVFAYTRTRTRANTRGDANVRTRGYTGKQRQVCDKGIPSVRVFTCSTTFQVICLDEEGMYVNFSQSDTAKEFVTPFGIRFHTLFLMWGTRKFVVLSNMVEPLRRAETLVSTIYRSS